MKNNKVFILIEVVLGIVAIILGTLMLTANPSPILGEVAVIIPDSDDSQWAALKYGMKMAASDRNVEMFVVDTEEKLSQKDQQTLIQQEIDNGADAVIVKPVDGVDTESMLKKFEKQVPVLLIESSARLDNKRSSLVVTAPDNFAIGEALGKQVLKDYAGDLTDKTIGLVASSEKSLVTTERERGFNAAIKDKGGKVSWSVSGSFGAGKEKTLEAMPTVNLIVGLDDSSVIAAGYYSTNNDLQGAIIYGAAHSTEALTYLDKDAVECLVVPDEFSVGYDSVVKVSKRLQQPFWKNKDSTVDYTILRQEDLFLKKNQDLLFMMNQ